MTDTTLIQRLHALYVAGHRDEMKLAADALEQHAIEIALRRGERMRLESELFDARTRMADQAAQIAEKDVEIARLTECLSKANANHEHFERAWYLRGDEVDALRADAERYRWLRMRDWFNSELCVLRDPKRVLTEGIGLGADCPSLSRLDAAIDAALRQEQPDHIPTRGEMVGITGEGPT